jgi:hypothetical protein
MLNFQIMQKLRWELLLLVVLVVACSTTPTLRTTPESSALPAHTPLVTKAVTLQATQTPVRIQTLSVSATQTVNASVTPIPIVHSNECPMERPELELDLEIDGGLPQFRKTALNFLNEGGPIQKVADAVSSFHRELYVGDMTGDGVPEIGIADTALEILGCVDGTYQSLLIPPLGFMLPAKIFAVTDMDLNSMPEVVFYHADSCMMTGRCSEAMIYEWDGNEFQNKVGNEYDSISMDGPFILRIDDIDNNATLELLTIGGIGTGDTYQFGLPWREQTNTYMWNSDRFSLYRKQFAPPQYLFQAVQDADQAMLWQEYDEALELYQSAIFDETLESWSVERSLYEQGLAYMRYEAPTVTPAPTPRPDINEYAQLAVYARYRIMLLHILRGWTSDAKVVYDSLQDKFLAGKPGHIYAEISRLFWTEYEKSKSVEAACNKTIVYVTEHEDEALSYIGDYNGQVNGGYHGLQSYRYQPEDICPF